MDSLSDRRCACGCGGFTLINNRNNAATGHIKGQANKFIADHSFKKHGPEHVVEDRGYKTPCWIWQRGTHRRGYGLTHLAVDNYRPKRYVTRLAHVVYWERSNGPVPPGLELDHLCRVTACVNPEHLEAVTHTENVRRGNRCGPRNKEGAA